jgi:hypothetical protein
MTRASITAVAVLGVATVGAAQPRLDVTRLDRRLDQELYFRPSPQGIGMASSGFEEALSNILWVRATLTFGERFDKGESGAWHEWLVSVIDTVSHLDPGWRTPYLYGGGMLSAVGLTEAAAGVYERCTAALPKDYWCPFARGMNDFLYQDDPEGAARWLKLAAERPEAPPWYGAAAAAMSDRGGQRKAAMVYLREEIATTDNEGVRHSLEFQLGRLQHDELVESWSAECIARRDSGRRLRSPDELPPPGKRLPENPRGDAWIVGADGVVRGSVAETERIRRALQREWSLIRR